MGIKMILSARATVEMENLLRMFNGYDISPMGKAPIGLVSGGRSEAQRDHTLIPLKNP